MAVESCPRQALASQDETSTGRTNGLRIPVAGQGGVVPYITSWSGERAIKTRVIARGRSGIGYADETLLDRDEQGVLWVRKPSRPTYGRPEFRSVHPMRQRRAMRRLLCQVCGQPADRDEQGVLWLLRDYREDWPDWPEGMANTYPPVCLSCARLSVHMCPALRRGYVLVRARRFPMTGVYGVRYRPAGPKPVSLGDVVVGYDDPVIHWTRAAQQVRSLHDCTIVTPTRAEPLGGSE